MIVNMHLSIGLVGCDRDEEVEIPDKDLEVDGYHNMSEIEQEAYVSTWLDGYMSNYLERSWVIVHDKSPE